MCRNIKTLYHLTPPVTDDEVRDAARQYVRKVSGFGKPSRANEAASVSYTHLTLPTSDLV